MPEVDPLTLGLRRQLEVLERLGVLEPSAVEPELKLLGLPPLDLVGQQPEQELGVGQAVVGGLAGAQLEGAGGVGAGAAAAEGLQSRQVDGAAVGRGDRAVAELLVKHPVGRSESGGLTRHGVDHHRG